MTNYKKNLRSITIVGASVLVIWFGIMATFGTANPFYIVKSGSMMPELQVYDLIVVSGNIAFAEVQVGDIIVYERPEGHDRVIVHRVMSVIDDNPKILKTKGDANPASIPGTDFPITKSEYLGTVLYVIPQIGHVTQFLQPVVTFVIVGIVAIFVFFKTFSKWK